MHSCHVQDTYDEELLGAVAELLPVMATALGPQTYGPVFQQLVFQPLLKRFQPGQPDGVRSTMIGRPPPSPLAPHPTASMLNLPSTPPSPPCPSSPVVSTLFLLQNTCDANLCEVTELLLDRK